MKKSAILALSLSTILSACCDCTTSQYVESNPLAIRLGVSSIQDVMIQGKGGYELEGNITINGKTINALTYLSMEGGVLPEAKTRYTTYFFYNNKLVGKETSSRFSKDSTNFDVDKAKTIKNGTTLQQVVAELGKPSGTFIYPIAKNLGDTGIAYYNISIHPLPFEEKTETVHEARISFDKNGKVDNVTVTDDNQTIPFDAEILYF